MCSSSPSTLCGSLECLTLSRFTWRVCLQSPIRSLRYHTTRVEPSKSRWRQRCALTTILIIPGKYTAYRFSSPLYTLLEGVERNKCLHFVTNPDHDSDFANSSGCFVYFHIYTLVYHPQRDCVFGNFCLSVCLSVCLSAIVLRKLWMVCNGILWMDSGT